MMVRKCQKQAEAKKDGLKKPHKIKIGLSILIALEVFEQTKPS